MTTGGFEKTCLDLLLCLCTFVLWCLFFEGLFFIGEGTLVCEPPPSIRFPETLLCYYYSYYLDTLYPQTLHPAVELEWAVSLLLNYEFARDELCYDPCSWDVCEYICIWNQTCNCSIQSLKNSSTLVL